jgi:hypothetical protein
MDEASGVAELRDALAAIGLRTETPPAGEGIDLVLIMSDEARILAQIKRLSLVSMDSIERLRAHWNNNHSLGSGIIRIIVADRVTAQVRQLLREAGWSWLDLRGHLHLDGPGIFVDTDVPQMRQEAVRPTPLAGQVGQEVAALLLLDPAKPAAVREIARTLGRSASTVSQALASMRQASLIDEDRRPVIPDLFWALAERWKPDSTDLGSVPLTAKPGGERSIEDALRLGITDPETTTGWALTDTLAAAAYGAPIGARSDHPPDFYVPDRSVLRRAVNLLGVASSHEGRAATVRVAPFPLVCRLRVSWDHELNQEWPLVRPLFVALDLANDPGRGREVLNGWMPPSEVGHRVW